MNLRTEWHDARRRYEATLSGLTARMAVIALDDFERLCGCPATPDVLGMVNGFVEALRDEGVDRESLAIYREAVVSFATWASNQWRVAA